MRAFIAALLAASVLGRSKPVGGYNYNKGGEDWTTYYADDATVDAALCATGKK